MATGQENAFEAFLKGIDQAKYIGLLNRQGYENYQDIFLLNEHDLDSVDIKDISDRNTILNAVGNINISSWLQYYQLMDYEDKFKRQGLNTLRDLKKIAMCDDIMDKLDVKVPGHRKRLTIAASHICLQVADSLQQPSTAQRTQLPVAYGVWEKNEIIPAETEFLWVQKCYIQSNVAGQDAIELLNCLVDTASEVVTVKTDILSKLNLQFLQNIKSRGIHTEEDKPLFRGTLMLGTKRIEVDVMPDSYNSVGCNVFKQFSHFIDGRNHLWFDSES